jgi:protein-L-isoaspartate(D-aspartate) O-methyltransferase
MWAGRCSVGKAILVMACLSLFFSCPPDDDSVDSYKAARERMVTGQIEARGVRDPRVLRALRSVPRHLFVPPQEREGAYDDRPLPIGEGQTISQPYIVALMTELSRPTAEDRALEVGTGSGYQAAVLSELVREVYTIEIVESLGKEAAERLKDLGYRNIHARVGDGYQGWPEAAPFDIILVTAAPEQVPPPLLDQLGPGGRMIIPVGGLHEVQSLQILEKDLQGRIRTRDVLPVRFVPLTRPQ